LICSDTSLLLDFDLKHNKKAGKCLPAFLLFSTRGRWRTDHYPTTL